MSTYKRVFIHMAEGVWLVQGTLDEAEARRIAAEQPCEWCDSKSDHAGHVASRRAVSGWFRKLGPLTHDRV